MGSKKLRGCVQNLIWYECGIAKPGPYVVRFICRDSPDILHYICMDSSNIVNFKCRDCLYVVLFKCRDCTYVKSLQAGPPKWPAQFVSSIRSTLMTSNFRPIRGLEIISDVVRHSQTSSDGGNRTLAKFYPILVQGPSVQPKFTILGPLWQHRRPIYHTGCHWGGPAWSDK